MRNPFGPLPCRFVVVANRVGLMAQWIGLAHAFFVHLNTINLALIGFGFVLMSVVQALNISFGTRHD